MVTPGGAIKSFETDPWPLNPKTQGSGAGLGVRRTFCLELHPPGILCGAEVASEAGIYFMETESELLKTLPVSHQGQGYGVGVGVAALCPRPELGQPGHLTRARAPVSTDACLESRVGV